MEIKPPVAIAIVVVVVLVAGFLIWRSSGAARFKAPPPITTGAPVQSGQVPGGGPQIQTGTPVPPGAPPGGMRR